MQYKICALFALFTMSCAQLPKRIRSEAQYQVALVTDLQSRQPSSQGGTPSHILVSECRGASCTQTPKTISFKDFVQHLEKKKQLKSFLSHQASLLEQQLMSLRVDRDSLQNEVQEMDRRLQMNQLSSLRNVTQNIRQLRASVQMELAEIDKKMELTQKDLLALQQPIKTPRGYAPEVERFLHIIDSENHFGQSLSYRDNLVAQEIDAIVRQMM